MTIREVFAGEAEKWMGMINDHRRVFGKEGRKMDGPAFCVIIGDVFTGREKTANEPGEGCKMDGPT
jgi:hypothetical protein